MITLRNVPFFAVSGRVGSVGSACDYSCQWQYTESVGSSYRKSLTCSLCKYQYCEELKSIVAPSFEDTLWYRNAKVRVWLWISPTFQFKSEEKSKSVLHGVPKSLIGPQNEKNLVVKRKHCNLLNDYCTPNSNKKCHLNFPHS